MPIVWGLLLLPALYRGNFKVCGEHKLIVKSCKKRSHSEKIALLITVLTLRAVQSGKKHLARRVRSRSPRECNPPFKGVTRVLQERKPQYGLHQMDDMSALIPRSTEWCVALARLSEYSLDLLALRCLWGDRSRFIRLSKIS